MSERERKMLYDIPYMWNLRKAELIERVEWQLKSREWGKWKNVGQRVQTFSQKMNWLCRSNLQHVIILNNTVLYT